MAKKKKKDSILPQLMSEHTIGKLLGVDAKTVRTWNYYGESLPALVGRDKDGEVINLYLPPPRYQFTKTMYRWEEKEILEWLKEYNRLKAKIVKL